MNPVDVQPVIMAGGSGTRLWPLSRAGYPKQFLVLAGNESLFQQAARRLAALAGDGVAVGAPLVVGNEEHRFLVLDQLREQRLEPAAVLLEPAGRNTAPALTLAALQAMDDGRDPVLAVTPADQTVADDAAFTRALRDAVRIAAHGEIAILGVPPLRPETGYGYIRAASPGAGDAPAVAPVREKPPAGNRLWVETEAQDADPCTLHHCSSDRAARRSRDFHQQLGKRQHAWSAGGRSQGAPRA